MSNIFDDIVTGRVDLDNSEVFTEAYYPDSLPYLKTLTRRVDLPIGDPIGRGNVCFLYTKNQTESLEIINGTTNFNNRHKYGFYYYNLYYKGKLYNKPFRFKDFEQRKKYYETIKKNTNNILPLVRLLNSSTNNKNMYYELFRYIEIFDGICSKLSFRKYITLYWQYFTNIYNIELIGYRNRFVLINLDNFSLGKTLRENLSHPLFNLYYTAFKFSSSIAKLDIDMYFYTGKKVLRVNPSKINNDSNGVKKLRIEMKKILDKVPEATIDALTDEKSIEVQVIASDTVHNISNSIIADEVSEITSTEDLKKNSKESPMEKEIRLKVDAKMKAVAPILKATTVVDADKIADTVTTNVKKELDEDKEMLQKIYNENKRKTNTQSKSAASTARDAKLREDQKNINMGGITIGDLEKIKTEEVKIPTTDISRNLQTTNKNMANMKFQNFDKTYNEKVMKKDISNAFTSLNKASIPLFVLSVDVQDTSDELNYKETYTIVFEDGNRKRHTVKVDIPKFIDNQFLYLGGNNKIIKHQNFYLPVVKVNEDMVEIVTNYSKLTLQRVDNKSTSSVERLKKLVATNENVAKYFVNGNAFVNNREAITAVIYDALSKIFISFKCGNTFIMFDQLMVKEYMKKNNIPEKPGTFYIGKNKGKDCYLDINSETDINTGTDESNRQSLVDIIISAMPEDIQAKFGNTKSPKRLMYARVKIMKQFMSVGLLLGLWEGLSTVLKKTNTSYRLSDNANNLGVDEDFVKFKDCCLVYKQDIPSVLILNGLKLINTAEYNLVDFDGKEPYIPYLQKVYGRVIIENALMNFYEFFIDPITLEILQTQNLPTDIVSVFIYALNLLSDSQHAKDINQNLSRIRHSEIIPAILYEKLAKNYIQYRNSNGRKKFTIPQDCVIKEILGLKTVEDYSTLNPYLELQQTYAVSTKGFRGVNLDEAYTPARRGYDPSMTGVIAAGTSPDGGCGINRVLTMEPNIVNIRGMIKDTTNNLDEDKDVNLMSPVELTLPMAATIDDPNRLGHAMKQSSHVVPMAKSSPVLISNGMDEVARFHLTSNFVINADEDGEIVDYDEDSKILIAKYKSGKCKAIDLSPNIVKNGGGGFFLSNVLTTKFKVGDKFKAGDCLAYHKDFFTNDKFNNCRLNIGPLTKIAIMSTYNTYEDSTLITQKLSKDCATEMCFCKSAVIGKNSNVFYIVNKGHEISVGDPLVKFDTSFEDETINSILANLGDADKANIMEGARNEIKSKYSGVIEDIKIYSTVDLDDMSPSLRKIVNSYYRAINRKKDFLNKYDPENKESVVKCGMLVKEASHKINPSKFGVIKGDHVEDSVLIEFYIKHSEPLEVGSKIANFTALKNTIGEILPEGYEPYSEFRPDEEISTLIASNSILNRMVPSILLTALGNKCIIELKRYLKDLNFDRAKMEKTIYSFFTAFDKSGTNTKKYKDRFSGMSDTEFKKYFTDFFADENAYLILDICDYERNVTMEDIERAAKIINVPLYENVFLPHLTMDKKHVICTKVPVPVGYINEKRTQQTVMKKNGISTDIAERSAITNQVTGKDKNGRESDLENTMLTALGLTNTLKELNAPRADDTVMKQQMLRDIAVNGYTSLADMTDEIQNKTTLNTVDMYFLAMSLKTDLVTSGLMTNKTLKEEL